MIIIGVDEVGRGCLAGDVVAGAFFFKDGISPTDFSSQFGLKDSKKLSPKKRNDLLVPMMEAGHLGVGSATHQEIDALKINHATFLAMRRALEALPIAISARGDYEVIVDGNVLPNFQDMGWGKLTCMVKADDKVPEVSAASVGSKEFRDTAMKAADLLYPEYDFAGNAGYGVQKHFDAIKELGFCAIHRHSFEPIKSMVLNKGLCDAANIKIIQNSEKKWMVIGDETIPWYLYQSDAYSAAVKHFGLVNSPVLKTKSRLTSP